MDKPQRPQDRQQPKIDKQCARNILATLLTIWLIGQVIVNVPGAGILATLFVAGCAAVLVFRHVQGGRQRFLHPAPTQYPVQAKAAFTRIRSLLNEASYNIGDTWHVVTADTQTGRIVANLRFYDERTLIEGDISGHVRVRRERQLRFIALEVQIKQCGPGLTAVQLDFAPKVEDANIFACDRVIAQVCQSVDEALGAGTCAKG